MKNLSIFWKLLLSIFIVSALSILSFGMLFFINQKKALIERTTAQLKSVNMLKKKMIENRLQDDEKFIWHFVRKVMLFNNNKNFSPLVEFNRHKDFLKDFCKDYGHLDVFLLDEEKNVVDNLYDQQLNGVDNDTSRYSFVRIFLIDDSKYSIALLTSTSYLEELLFERAGMGNSGESYLAKTDGKLITKSRFLPHIPPQKLRANTNTIDSALHFEKGNMLTKDYRGIKVLSAFATISHNKEKWVVISEIDISEAMRPVEKLRVMIIYLSIFLLCMVLVITLYLSASISKPIKWVSSRIEKISKGIIPEKMIHYSSNELGQMHTAMNRLIDSFGKITEFASEIGKGNLNAHFEPLGASDSLGKSLLNMREQLISYRTKEANMSKQKALFLLEGQENERRRIARDFHDGLGQWLTGLKLKIASADLEPTQKEELKSLVSETIEEARRITNNLMPSVLIDFGLDAALRQLCNTVQKNSDVLVQYTFEKQNDNPLPFDTSITFYRIAQEALNNIVKHAKAKEVKLALKKGTESISMAIEDNGVGFSVETDKVKGNGLHNMEERVKLLNGSLSIGSDNTGTKLNIFIPLKK